jgi:hypothetical protein
VRTPFDVLARLRSLEARGAVRALAEALREERIAAEVACQASARAAWARGEANGALLRGPEPSTGVALDEAARLAMRRRGEEGRRVEEAHAAAGAASLASERLDRAAGLHRAAREARRSAEDLARRWTAERRRALERRHD